MQERILQLHCKRPCSQPHPRRDAPPAVADLLAAAAARQDLLLPPPLLPHAPLSPSPSSPSPDGLGACGGAVSSRGGEVFGAGAGGLGRGSAGSGPLAPCPPAALESASGGLRVRGGGRLPALTLAAARVAEGRRRGLRGGGRRRPGPGDGLPTRWAPRPRAPTWRCSSTSWPPRASTW